MNDLLPTSDIADSQKTVNHDSYNKNKSEERITKSKIIQFISQQNKSTIIDTIHNISPSKNNNKDLESINKMNDISINNNDDQINDNDANKIKENENFIDNNTQLSE